MYSGTLYARWARGIKVFENKECQSHWDCYSILISYFFVLVLLLTSFFNSTDVLTLFVTCWSVWDKQCVKNVTWSAWVKMNILVLKEIIWCYFKIFFRCLYLSCWDKTIKKRVTWCFRTNLLWWCTFALWLRHRKPRLRTRINILVF